MIRGSHPETSSTSAVALLRAVVVAVLLTTAGTDAGFVQTEPTSCEEVCDAARQSCVASGDPPQMCNRLYSDCATACRPRAPIKPDPVRINDKTTTRIRLSWLDRSDVETGFAIYRSVRGEQWLELDQVGSVEGSYVWGSYSDSTLDANTYYCYRIDVYNEYGRSFSDPTCTYTNRVTAEGTVVVEDYAGLAGELHAASEGRDIYVHDGARIRVDDTLRIGTGVTLRSGRGALNDGALIYTDRRDLWPALEVRGVNVRISGLRIQGAQRFVAKTRRAEGIQILLGRIEIARQFDATNKIEIDNNEIYGWSRSAIRVEDNDAPATDADRIVGRINGANAMAVHIHDNYIHHNQHRNSAGYGVVLRSGAYALIERNVFNHNRHAIAADGREGTGYIARRNLVLEGGGKHIRVWKDWGTHQFDMHGRDNCGWKSLFSDSLYNCGLAGEYMEIRQNAFQYVKGAAFKLRGEPHLWNTPEVDAGAVVLDNVFAHLTERTLKDSSGHIIFGALVGPGEYIRTMNNLYGIDTAEELGAGDFDGDGVCDEFQATGVTWWYSSGGRMGWRYLNTAPERLRVLVLEDVDDDEITDVLTEREDGWFVSYAGVEPWGPLEYAPQMQSDLRSDSARLGRTEGCD